jgi:glycosyltransferase involved in cell wall biosynthesis
MKIAVWHNLPSGGGKRCLRDHVEGLLARGHALAAWTTTEATRDFLPLSELIEERVAPLTIPRGGGLVDKLTNKARLIESFRAHSRQVSAEIDAGGFDVVLVHSSMGIHCPPLARDLKTPSVLYLHEPNRPLYEAGEAEASRGALYEALAARGRRLLMDEEKSNAAAFPRIAANSAFTREALLRAMAVDSRVCPPGVDVRRFKPGGGQREPYAVGVGSIQPRKNVEFVIESLGRIADPARRRLRWIGNAPEAEYRTRLERLAEDRDVALSLEADVTDAALLDALQRATAFVYAPRLEPLGLAPLEAMACETPVVAVAEGGCRETVREGGTLVQNDPDEFSRAVEALYDDPAAAQATGRRGRIWVEAEWTLERAAERLEGHLKAVARA